MKRATIDGEITVQEGTVRFKREDTPSNAYERLTDGVSSLLGVAPETVPDGTALGTATLTVHARDDERLFIDGDVVSTGVRLRESVITEYGDGIDDTVDVTVGRELAEQMAGILRSEVRHADEYHSTEQYMEEMADALDTALEDAGGDT